MYIIDSKSHYKKILLYCNLLTVSVKAGGKDSKSFAFLNQIFESYFGVMKNLKKF